VRQVVLSMKRRATMAPLVSRVWKWFEISSGKWCPYGPQQNKAIDQAFWAGEQSLKITSGRRKYNIQVSHKVFSQVADPDP
jgi:E3 ubiquitin-protein ligase HUWE1